MTNTVSKSGREKSYRSMLKVAITGGAGSGKTTVCNRLKTLGLDIISTDGIAREVVSRGSPVYSAIANYFGEQVLKPDGMLDRKRLRQIIIKDTAARRTLEGLIHPEILKRLQQRMSDAKNRGEAMVLVEIPLIFELGLADQFDVVVTVTADRKRRIERLMIRDQVSRNEADGLLNAQLSDEEKIKQSDIVIKNDGSVAHVIRAVDDLYCMLREKISKIS